MIPNIVELENSTRRNASIRSALVFDIRTQAWFGMTLIWPWKINLKVMAHCLLERSPEVSYRCILGTKCIPYFVFELQAHAYSLPKRSRWVDTWLTALTTDLDSLLTKPNHFLLNQHYIYIKLFSYPVNTQTDTQTDTHSQNNSPFPTTGGL